MRIANLGLIHRGGEFPVPTVSTNFSVANTLWSYLLGYSLPIYCDPSRPNKEIFPSTTIPILRFLPKVIQEMLEQAFAIKLSCSFICEIFNSC